MDHRPAPSIRFPVRELARERSAGLVAVALVILVVSVYGQAGDFSFIGYDDPHYVSGNPHVRPGLSLEGASWALTAFHGANWHPVTWLSHMLDVSLFGMDAGKHHLVNVLLHLLNSLLLFHALRKMTGRVWESGAVAALFAVHPLHVESVAWVAERKDVLSGFFGMAALCAYARYCDRPGIRRYLPLLLLYGLGLMAKPILVTLPFVLLLLDYWPIGRLATRPLRRLVVEKIPLFLLSAISCVITFLAQASGEAVRSLGTVPFLPRLENALLAYASYLAKTAWPSGLAFFYPHPMSSISHPAAAGAGLLLLGMTALAVLGRRRRPHVLMGWLWFLGTLVPVIGLVQVGEQAMADRYTYLPLIGIFVAVAWETSGTAARWRLPVRATAGAAGAGIVALAIGAWGQAGYWRDTASISARALELSGENWYAQFLLGQDAANHGRTEEAIARFNEVIRIRPDHLGAHNDLGVLLSKLGRTRAAMDELRIALRIRPDSAEAHLNIGDILYREGKTEEAAGHFGEAIRIDPDDGRAYYALGRALYRQGKPIAALARYGDAIRVQPDYPEARNEAGIILKDQGAYDEAITQFREALRSRPDYDLALFNLGVTLRLAERRGGSAAGRP